MSKYILKLVIINFSEFKTIPGLELEINQFSKYFHYIGCDFNIRELEYKNLNVKFQIWNLSPSFDDILDFYLIGSMGAIILFDHQNVDSFLKTMFFIDRIWSINGSNTIPITLIGLNPINSRDKAKDPSDQIQEVINQFLNPQKNGLILRYIPYIANLELILDKLLVFYADNHILGEKILVAENRENRQILLKKIGIKRISVDILKQNSNLHGISCFMDKFKTDLDSLIGWVKCLRCGMFICPSCLELIISDNYYYCPGSIYREKHGLDPLTIF